MCYPWPNCWSTTPNQEVISKGKRKSEALATGTTEDLSVELKAPRTSNTSEPLFDCPGAPSKQFSDSLYAGLAKGNPALRSASLLPNHNRSSQFPPENTLFSDWGELFDANGSIRLSQNRSPQQSALSNWSDCTTQSPRKTEFKSESGASTSGPKIVLKPGTVMAMQLAKKESYFTIINLDITLQDVVKTFLSKNTGGVELPVSYEESANAPPKLLSTNRMAMSLRENLGRNFNIATQGLTFSSGPVNSKLCFKMRACDLRQLHKMFSLCLGGNYAELEELGKHR